MLTIDLVKEWISLGTCQGRALLKFLINISTFGCWCLGGYLGLRVWSTWWGWGWSYWAEGRRQSGGITVWHFTTRVGGILSQDTPSRQTEIFLASEEKKNTLKNTCICMVFFIYLHIIYMHHNFQSIFLDIRYM